MDSDAQLRVRKPWSLRLEKAGKLVGGGEKLLEAGVMC